MVLLDLDGVVFDLLTSVEHYLFNEKGINVNLRDFKFYDFSDFPDSVRREIVKSFSVPAVFENEQYYTGAYKAVQLLKKVTDVRAYTMLNTDNALIEVRKRQMKSLDISGDIYSLDSGKKVYSDADAIFEDSIANIKPYVNTETQIYVIDHVYNRADELQRIGGIAETDFIRRRNLLCAVEHYINGLPDKVLH